MLARDKHSSLLRKSVYYGQKSFITLAPGLKFWSKARSYPSEAPALSHKIILDWKKPVINKHTSFLRTCMNYRCKKFYNIGPCCHAVAACIWTEYLFEQCMSTVVTSPQNRGFLWDPKIRHDRMSRQPTNLKWDVSVPVPPVSFLTSW
jgi:hypothetical protein